MNTEFINQLFNNHFKIKENSNDRCRILSRNTNSIISNTVLNSSSDRAKERKMNNSDEQLQHDITSYTRSLDNFEECEKCEGTGYINESDYCCAELLNEEDYICSDCMEHCDKMKCSKCDGMGTVKKSINEPEYEPE